MYLSRVELDTTRRSTMLALSNPQKLHGAVEASFSGVRRRRLWRLDKLGGKLYLLLLSEDKPELSGLAGQFGPQDGGVLPETRSYDPLLQRISAGSVWQFRLTANPVKSCPNHDGRESRGVVRAHCTVEYQKQWLLERAAKHGFALEADGFDVTASQWLRFAKGGESGRPVSLLSVTYEGVLKVTDAALFCLLLTNGIGRGKAYGLGLMTVLQRGCS